jgi:hypothetical protein
MTEERLAELEALEKGATAGPWLVTRESGQGWLIATIEGEDERQVNVVTNGTAPGIKTFPGADAALIAEARNALPELLAEVRRLRAACEAALAKAEQCSDPYVCEMKPEGLAALYLALAAKD